MTSARSSVQPAGHDAPAQDSVDALDQSILETPIEPAPLEYLERPFVAPGKVEKRAYQVNLAVAALSRPSLIVLPTGLGKTVIAAIMAADTLNQRPGDKILMLAPTKPLVEQHARFMREHLTIPDDQKEEDWIPAFSGSMAPERRSEKWAKANLVVATPQVISNDVLSGRYHLRDVSLVIFDEAHRATGDYPYVWISDRFHHDNPYGNRLGLTASPGSSSEKILEVCTNLGLSGMELRTDMDEDVRPYLFKLDLQWEKVPQPPRLKAVAERLQEAIKGRVDMLRRQDLLRHVSGVPSRKDLVQVAGQLQARIQNSEDPPRALFEAMSVQAQALKIAHALELVDTQGAEALLVYWKRLESEHAGKGASKATTQILADPRLKEAVALAREAKEEDPKAERVVDAVRTELTVNDDPRIIVFANYRDTVERIRARLEKVPNCRPVRFVGQSSREGDKGLTQKEQYTLLEEFRDGTHNVLIATSVAEEGLDIPKTDLVIFHEPVPSEIRAIQRRGRTGRARAGRALILMYKGTRDEAYHWSAQRRETGMRRELRMLKAKVDRGLREQRQTKLGESRRRPEQDTAGLVPPRNPPPPDPPADSPRERESLAAWTPPPTDSKPEDPLPADSNDPAPEAKTVDADPAPTPDPPASNKGKSQTSVKSPVPRLTSRPTSRETTEAEPHASEDPPAPNPASQIMLREHVDPNAMVAMFRHRAIGKDAPLLIVVDHRENRSMVTKELESMRGVHMQSLQLTVADYALSDRVVVERKSVEDFLESLVSGRLFMQARQMVAYPRPIMIVEGEGLTTTRNIPRGSVFAALASLTTDFGISVLTVKDARETADLLVSIAKREQTEPRRDAPVRLGKVAMNDHDRRRFLLEGLPHVSAVLSRRLLHHFQTVENVARASEEQLLEVEGIGRKTAKDIRRILADTD